VSTNAASSPQQSEVLHFLRSSLQQLFVFAALIVVFVFFMFSVNNFGLGIIPDILLQSAAIGTMALGATFIIATGGIDLSVGTGMTFCAVMAGVFMSSQFMDLPLGLGLLLTLLVGVAVGLVNGILIAFLGLPPFIATLAMMMVTRGLSLIISKSSSIKIANPDYFAIANGDLLPFLSNAALIFVILGIAAAVLLSKTLLGRYALAIGSNEEATRLSGVNVKVWKLLVYVIAGLFTAFGAESLFLLIAQVTIIVIVAELRILPRCFTAFPHLIGGREILIDIPTLNELLKNLLVNVLTFTLRLTIRFMRAAYAHAFVPVNAQPVQTVEHLVERFFRISCRIGILNTENELTAGMARISPVKQGCTYHAHVRGSGR